MNPSSMFTVGFQLRSFLVAVWSYQWAIESCLAVKWVMGGSSPIHSVSVIFPAREASLGEIFFHFGVRFAAIRMFATISATVRGSPLETTRGVLSAGLSGVATSSAATMAAAALVT